MNLRRVGACGALATAILAFPLVVTADDTGIVKGKVTYKGENAPKRTKIQMDADAACAKMHEKAVGTENFIMDKETKALQNVIVYLKEGAGGKKFDPPATGMVIDQVGCMYSPHVMTMQVGQKLTIRNSDDTSHNIHSLSEKNTPFNFAQAKKGLERDETFKQGEIFKVKCDVHPWMSAYIGVFDHPFHAVTGKDGTYEIKGLPAGKYTIVAWHEEFGEAATAEVTVSPGAPAEVNLTIEEKK